MFAPNTDIVEKKGSKWIVAYTRSRHEHVAGRNLSDKNISVYIPYKTELRQWSDRKKLVTEPMFRSYVFVYANTREYCTALFTPGVIRFICNNGKPLEVSSTDMDLIRKAASSGIKVDAEPARFIPGEKVLITKGTLKGLTGILVEIRGKHKVVVLLESLAMHLLVEIPLGYIKKV